MASAKALIAAGIPPLAADLLGDTPGSVTLTGTTQATAASLKYSLNNVTAAASQTGGILQNKNVGHVFKVVNTSGTNATVYPPVGGAINGLSANTGVTVSANKAGYFEVISVSTSGVASYMGIAS